MKTIMIKETKIASEMKYFIFYTKTITEKKKKMQFQKIRFSDVEIKSFSY